MSARNAYLSVCCGAPLVPDLYTVMAWFCSKCGRHHFIKKGVPMMEDSYACREEIERLPMGQLLEMQRMQNVVRESREKRNGRSTEGT